MKVTIVVREVGRTSPDYSLEFEMPAVPAEGQYISVFRPDAPQHSEDLIVRHVWWHLGHPETATVSDGSKVGAVANIMVECDIAEGPYSLDSWRRQAVAARSRGIDVPEMEVSRYSLTQAEMAGTGSSSG